MDAIQNFALSCVCFWITITTLVFSIEYIIKPILHRLLKWWQEGKNKTTTAIAPSFPNNLSVYGSYQLIEHGGIGWFDLIYHRIDRQVWIFIHKGATIQDAMMALDRQLQCGLSPLDHNILQKIIKTHYIKHTDATCMGK